MAVDFIDGSDYVVFTTAAKTYIGKFHKSPIKDSTVSNIINTSGGVHSTLGYDNDCYFIENPCEVDFELTIPTSGSAELKWTLKPVFYKDVVTTSEDLQSRTIVFTYPKSQVAVCNIGGSTIDATLLDAYKELCE